MSEARDIVRALNGDWHGSGGNAPCPCCQPEGRRDQRGLSVSDRGGRLLAHCHKSGCAFADILAALRHRGLVSDDGPSGQVGHLNAGRRSAEEQAERERKMHRARQIWADAVSAAGTLAERYLRARAIRGPLPPTIRFASECLHPNRQTFPAMICAVQVDGIEQPVGVHRTFLSEPARKALVTPVKAMLGSVRGGAVRLSSGPGPLVVAEGIETALTLRDELAPDQPSVWAGLSAPGVAGLRLPPSIGELVIAPDGDPAGENAAKALAERAYRLGWRIRIMAPPAPGRDWNSWAMEAADAAA